MSSSRLRVASYNIRKAMGLDRRRDPGRVLDVINGLDADVVVLQEADRRLGDRPAALDRGRIDSDSDFSVAPLAVNDVSLGWHGNAVLVRKGLPVKGVDRFELPGLEPRGAVCVAVGDEGRTTTVIGVHLGLIRKWRMRQIDAIRAHLGPKMHANALIAGDFNEWSATIGLEALEYDFQVVSPGFTYHAARPVAGLDRLALGRNLSLKDAGVEEGALARRASDHLPIWADIERC